LISVKFLLSLKFHIFTIVRTILVYGLVTFYFLISIRLTVNLHYCGGKIKTVTFVGFQEQKSCCKGKAMKKGCCKDVKLALKKASEDQKQAIAAPFFAHTIEFPVHSIIEVRSSEHFVPLAILPRVHAPPPQAFPPVFIKNCVFII
jgi:hypothetical protein